MPRTFFPSASEARYNSRSNITIFREIRDIEEAILLASAEGELEVIIDDSTMTKYVSGSGTLHGDMSVEQLSETYFKVWRNEFEDKVLEEQMKAVIKYFVDLDYSIVRKTSSNEKTFVWVLSW